MKQLFFTTWKKEWFFPAAMIFILSIWLSSERLVVLAGTSDACEKDLISGDITLGGFFPLHVSGQSGECSEQINAEGLKELEAMLFAVDRINRDEVLLPNITLGVRAVDTCQMESIALDRVLKCLVLGTSSNLSHVINLNKDCSSDLKISVTGVIGPETTKEAISTAKVLGIFEIPLISYGATSTELSDKSQYEYFSRTTPSDNSLVKAVVQILKRFNWTYVSIIYTDESYGRMAFDSLKQETKNHGICIAVEGKLPEKYNMEQYRTITDKLVVHDSAKIVVFFCREAQLVSFLSEMYKQATKFENMQFIGCVLMSRPQVVKLVRDIRARVIYIKHMSNSISDFDDYFLNLNPVKNRRNPWFEDFYEQAMNCSIDNQSLLNKAVCNPNQTLRSEKLLIDQNSLNRNTEAVDAVYAFAHALHRIHESVCVNNSLKCKLLCKVSGKGLLDTIRNGSFTSLTGRKIQFDSYGDVTGRFAVIYYFHDETFGHVKIGEWEGKLRLNSSSLWTQKFISVKSRCSKPCEVHQIQRGISEKPSCCWKCENCRPDEIVYNKTTCRMCEQGYIPDETFGTCLKVHPTYYTFDGSLSFFLVIPPLVLSFLGVLAVVFIVCIFIKFNNTPLVKASSRELSYLLLFGLFLSYLFPLVSILKPSPSKCFLQFVFDSLPTTVSNVAIVVKANRFFRIFDKKRRITRQPSFIRPCSQILLSLGLISFQVLLLTVFVILDFPRKELVHSSSGEVYLICSTSHIRLMLSHLYNIILVIVCTYYGYKTKHIPRNFNEAKYIAFAMYGSCVMIVTFVVLLVVIAERSDEVITLAVHCYRITLMSTVLLTCFFAPKVYIIVFKPEENINRPTFQDTFHETVESSRSCETSVKDDDPVTLKESTREVTARKTNRDWRRHSF